MLLYMEQTETFIALGNLLATPFFSALYTMNLERIWEYIKIYERLFEYLVYDVFQHFAKIGLSSEHYIVDWCVYTSISCYSINQSIMSC